MYIDLNKYSLDGRFTCGKWDIICLINCYISKVYILSIVETERLHICEITDKDSVALRLVLSDPEIMKYSIVGVHNDEDITKYESLPLVK